MPTLTSEQFHDLEERERQAVLRGDVASLETYWSPELLINGPHNQLLIGSESTLAMIRSGVINFERFDRTVERVEIGDDLAVSMGSEAIIQKEGPQAGQLIRRRYTNVWQYKEGAWKLRFRHANVVPQQAQILDQGSR